MPKILKIAVPVAIHDLFDYLPPPLAHENDLRPGVRVEVPFGAGKRIGILFAVADTSDIDPERLKPALAILDREPLFGPDDIKLLAWASRYYHHPIGETFATACAQPLRAGQSAAPETLRRLYAAAPHSPEAVQAVRRSLRQAELLRELWTAENGLSPEAVDEFESGKASARALIQKGLAVWRHQVVQAYVATAQTQAAPAPRLNPDQAAAVAAVTQALGSYQAFLLDGVTGSGKTEVYLRLAQEVVARGQQALILVPEISLTPQLEARFRARFPMPVAVYHSSLSEPERRRAWLATQRGEAAILLGTRSAVFTPMRAPGLIVLDEEHDASFKQQEGFRFSARDVAVMRAHLARVPIVLGSATPSLESLCNVEQGRYQLLRLPHRAGGATPPTLRLVDIRGQKLREGLSARLMGDMAATLERGEQVLLFVNRRGFAPTLMCHACGWVAQCRHCDANLVIHIGDKRLRCHHCGYEQGLTRACGGCGKQELQPQGLGTERIETALTEYFPAANIARIDRDKIRNKAQLETMLDAIHSGRVDILVGTQMLAKGHHFPRVTLVGIVNVDAGLYSTDFRAAERTAQLIMQVAGRAGREERPGTVLLQTRQPEHPLLQTLVRGGYSACAKVCAQERREAELPPFSYQALWRAEARKPETAQTFLKTLATRAMALPELRVLGPAPAPLARRAQFYRFQLLLQAGQRRDLHAALEHLMTMVPELQHPARVRWSIDVDPVDLF